MLFFKIYNGFSDDSHYNDKLVEKAINQLAE